MSLVWPHEVASPPSMTVSVEMLEGVKRVSREVSAVQTEKPVSFLVVLTGVTYSFIVHVWVKPDLPVQ